MAALLQDQNIKSDKWLAGLVDAMQDMSEADDICRAANPLAVSRLIEQLHSGGVTRDSNKFARLY